jgi:hypothetical protein
MKKYEQIKAKYREKAFPIIDEWTFDEAIAELKEELRYTNCILWLTRSMLAVYMAKFYRLEFQSTQGALFMRKERQARLFREKAEQFEKRGTK